jgi:hypothetical protein
MTTHLATAPPPAAPVTAAAAVARVHAVLDEVTAVEVVGPVTGGDVASLDRAISRMQAMKLQMVAAADRERVAESSGMSGTAPWLAAHTRTGGAEAAGTVGLAVALDAALPATREALTAGEVSTEHATIISGTMARLPEGLRPEERARVEVALVAKARRLDPPRLRRAARLALAAADRRADEVAAHEDAELRGEEERAAARVRLTMHDNRDGTVSGHFTVPAVAGAILRKVVQQIASPRRDRGEGAGAGVGDDGGSRQRGRAGGGVGSSAGAPLDWAPLDWAQRHGQAFVEILEHLPTDRLPGRTAANVVVTVQLEALRAELGVAHVDTGHDLSASQARRLACGAAILPAVLDGPSVPLDLGRTARFFSERQRTALATVYDECAADGCDRPYAWCDLHHEDPWSRDGATDLHLAVPLCGWHHRRVHDRAYEHSVRDVGGRKHVTFHRRT